MSGEASQLNRLGVVLVVSGPSGAGKSTVCRTVLKANPALHFSISCTTRAPRPGETDAVDYYFLSRNEFERRIRADAFLEHAEVHGNYYGTPRTEVEPYLGRGENVLLDIDVQGARQVRARTAAGPAGKATLFVFIAPPSLAELERRLRGRHTESDAAIECRLAAARREIGAWREYDYLVVNDEVPRAAARLQAILEAAQCGVRILTWDPLAAG